MKKGFSSRFLKKIVVIFLCIGVVFSFSGCLVEWIANSLKNPDAQKHLTEYMDAIPIETEGYTLNKTDTDKSIHNFEGTVVVGGKSVEILRTSEDLYTIKYDDKDIIINYKFLTENSEAYVKIHNMWKKNNAGGNNESYILSICAYDDRLFIVTCGYQVTPIPDNVSWMYPIVLFWYDLETGNVSYCNYSKHGSYRYLEIVKVGETNE